jgi:hypothetical protein
VNDLDITVLINSIDIWIDIMKLYQGIGGDFFLRISRNLRIVDSIAYCAIARNFFEINQFLVSGVNPAILYFNHLVITGWKMGVLPEKLIIINHCCLATTYRGHFIGGRLPSKG